MIPNEGDEIEFSKISTKAVTNITHIEGFEVSLSVTSKSSGSNYVSWLENECVYPTNDEHTSWGYNNTRYWMNGLYYYFVASYAYDLDDSYRTNIGSFQEITDNTGGYNQIGYSYEVNTDGEESGQNARIDIMTASDYVYTGEDWTARNVSLTFSHLLTKVNFRISQDLDRDNINNYYITKVTLSGVKNTGTYLVVPENGSFITAWAFNDEDSISSYSKSFDNYKLGGKDNPLLVWGEDGLLLIPQEIYDQSKVKIRVDYRHQYINSDDNTEDIIVERYIEEDIPATDLWKSNNVITYDISIANPNQIIFNNPSVESWGSPQTGGMIIIK